MRDLKLDTEDSAEDGSQSVGQSTVVREDQGEAAHQSAQLDHVDEFTITDAHSERSTPPTDMRTPPGTPMSHSHSIFEDVSSLPQTRSSKRC